MLDFVNMPDRDCEDDRRAALMQQSKQKWYGHKQSQDADDRLRKQGVGKSNS